MNQTAKNILFAVLGLITVGMIGLAAFRYFAPDPSTSGTKGASTSDASHDPEATVYISENGGKNWRGLSGVRFGVADMVFHPLEKVVFIATAKQGLWKSNETMNILTHLEDADGKITSADSVSDLYAPLQGGEANLYFATMYEKRGRLVSLRDGIFSERYFSPLDNVPVLDISGNPTDPKTVLFVSGESLFESKDAGTTWRLVFRFKTAPTSIVIHPLVPGRMWVTAKRGGLWKSDDYGKTWKDIRRGLSSFRGAYDNQRLFINQVTGILYLISDYGLLSSWDDGASWKSLPLIVQPDTLPIIEFAFHPQHPEIIYVAAASQLYKSTDGGVTWQGTQFSGKGNITSIIIDPETPERIFIGFSK